MVHQGWSWNQLVFHTYLESQISRRADIFYWVGTEGWGSWQALGRCFPWLSCRVMDGLLSISTLPALTLLTTPFTVLDDDSEESNYYLSVLLNFWVYSVLSMQCKELETCVWSSSHNKRKEICAVSWLTLAFYEYVMGILILCTGQSAYDGWDN